MNKIKKVLIIAFSVFSIIHSNAQSTYEVPEISIIVDGACGMCEKRIEETALKTPGVIEADWNVDNHKLVVRYDPDEFVETVLHKNIAGVGHDTDMVKADDKVYEELPLCCHYRSDDNPHKKSTSKKRNSKNVIKGAVYESDDEHLHPLLGSNLYLVNEKRGISTDKNGKFEFSLKNDNETIIVSFIGFKSDTLIVDRDFDEFLEIVLSSSIMLDEVHINHENRSSEFSFVDPIKVQKIGVRELKKAACCNLSESFETNPSVDVNFTDAVTGSKVIELLGLAGKYVQITRESMPYIRGLASIYGMNFTPGPWIESIQMIKGTGSVVNGFESMTGQINLEFLKPENADPLFVNLYGAVNGRLESNINLNHKFNDRISTGLLIHGSVKKQQSDRNGDGFLDEPTGRQFSVMNRWDTYFNNGFESKFGINVTGYKQNAGQKGFDRNEENSNLWGVVLDNDRVDAFIKIGKVFDNDRNESIGFQVSGVRHDQKNLFGKRRYDALQKSLYANIIFQSDLFKPRNTFKTGFSYQLDNIDEVVFTDKFTRSEKVGGAFVEYSLIPNDKFTAVGGFRVDMNNYYGLFVTPRINLKYSVSDRTIFRLAAGRGQKTANVFAENIGLLASSRNFVIKSEDNETPYGLKQEKSWNFGFNFTSEVEIWSKNTVFSVDYYHSRFEDQVVIDLENPTEVRFYNLTGVSYSNSIQTQIDLTLMKGLDIRMAYRFNDVKTDYEQGRLEKPLSSKHRAFINIGFETADKWKFDYTLNWQGRKRIPDTSTNPEEFRLAGYSPDFMTMNFQVTKAWKDVFEIYAGVENILDYKQANAIVSASDPYSDYFDSSLIWGPVMGRNIYVGLRYYLKG